MVNEHGGNTPFDFATAVKNGCSTAGPFAVLTAVNATSAIAA
jgi:hypothetical protein